MKLYTSDGCTYEGMTDDIVVTLRNELGRSTNFISQTEYDAYVEKCQSR